MMAGVGFLNLLGSATAANQPVVFTVGVLTSSLFFVLFAHMVLAYPHNRLERRWHEGLIGAGYVLAAVGPLPHLLWGFSERMCEGCPESPLFVAENEGMRVALTPPFVIARCSRSPSWGSCCAAGATRARCSAERWPRSCGRP